MAFPEFYLVQAETLSRTKIRVTFNIAADPMLAITAAQWGLSPSLPISSVAVVTGITPANTQYELTLGAEMTPGVAYTVRAPPLLRSSGGQYALNYVPDTISVPQTDADTIALWHLDDTEGLGIWESTQTSHLTLNKATPIVDAGINGKARLFSGSINYAQGPATAQQRADMKGEITVQMWLMTTPSGSFSDPFSLAGDPTSSAAAENYIYSSYITSTGMMNVYWDAGGGQPSTGEFPIPVGSLFHFAFTREITSPGICTARAYVNGQLVKTTTNLAIPTGGENAIWRMGALYINDNDYEGVIDEVKVQRVRLTDEQIFAIYQAAVTDAVDANTVALWKCDEDPTLAYFSNGVTTYYQTAYLFDKTGNHTLASQAGVGHVGGIDYRARSFTGSGNSYAYKIANAPIIAQALESWTIEAWIYVPSLPSGLQMIASLGGSGETEATNITLNASVIASGGQAYLNYYSETGAGVDVTATATNQPIPLNTWTFVAVRKTRTGATCTVDFFINGTLVQSFAGLTNPTGGTSGYLTVGSHFNAANFFNGYLDEIRISKIARSDAEIEAYRQIAIAVNAAESQSQLAVAKLPSKTKVADSVAPAAALNERSLQRAQTRWFAIRPEVTSTDSGRKNGKRGGNLNNGVN